MEIDDGGSGFVGDGVWQTVECRKGGFKTSQAAALYMSETIEKNYCGYTMSQTISKTSDGLWEIRFSGYRRA